MDWPGRQREILAANALLVAAFKTILVQKSAKILGNAFQTFTN